MKVTVLFTLIPNDQNLALLDSILFKSHIYCAEVSTVMFLLGGSRSGTRSARWGWKKQSFHRKGSLTPAVHWPGSPAQLSWSCNYAMMS